MALTTKIIDGDLFMRFCRKPGVRARRWPGLSIDSDSELFELLRERRLRIPGILRLSFAHHVDHLDAAQDGASAIHGLEPHHRANPPLDGPMILFDPIVEVTTVPDADRLALPS